MAAQPQEPLTEEEYLALERASDVRHEFYQGRMIAMAGASERHGTILTNTSFYLRGQLRDGSCRI